MGDVISARSTHDTTLRKKIDLEKRRVSYGDLHREDIKNRLNMAVSPLRDEIVRHMSNLPSYLQTGKVTPDRALSFGVMDWGRLEKWQYQHLNCSPSTSDSSPLFSTDGSTPQLSRGQSCSPARQKPHRATLLSHFNISSNEIFLPYVKSCLGNIDMGSHNTKSSILKGKMKIEDAEVNEPLNIQHPSIRAHDCDLLEKHKTLIPLPTNSHGNSATNIKRSSFSTKNSNLDKGTDAASDTKEKRSSFSSRNPNFDMGAVAASKQRSMSPIRRFSFGVSSKSSAASTSTMKGFESPVSQKLATDNNTCVSKRSHASPLRRLLEPLFPKKATNFHEDSKIKAKLDLSNDATESTSTTQALFQTTVKNGRPLFTFAVENNVLAATVKDISCSGKDNRNSWIYTFFTVDVKKKNASWLSHSKKDKSPGSVLPNVRAQMKVSNSNSDTREFSLYRVDPHDEVAAIVVKFLRNVDEEEESQERFSTTVILPGGNHGVSNNGKPSPLIERWRSGGACDCGGWDVGCRLRILTNRVKSSGRSDSPTGPFELFFQGNVVNERPFFNLCPLKEGIYSVKYNSTLSFLQALSICISVMECIKSSQYTESRTYVAKQVQDDPKQVRFASFPPLSPVGRV